MRYVGDILQDFFNNLHREGMQSPKEISFPKKMYKRIESELLQKTRFRDPHGWEDVIEFHHQTGTTTITRAKCKECGE